MGVELVFVWSGALRQGAGSTLPPDFCHNFRKQKLALSFPSPTFFS
jgi:hypothetical protein